MSKTKLQAAGGVGQPLPKDNPFYNYKRDNHRYNEWQNANTLPTYLPSGDRYLETAVVEAEKVWQFLSPQNVDKWVNCTNNSPKYANMQLHEVRQIYLVTPSAIPQQKDREKVGDAERLSQGIILESDKGLLYGCDLEKLADEHIKGCAKHTLFWNDLRRSFIAGYNAPHPVPADKVKTDKTVGIDKYQKASNYAQLAWDVRDEDRVNEYDNCREDFLAGYDLHSRETADLISREEVVKVVEQQIYKYESEAEEDESIIGYSDKKSKSEALTDLLEKFRR